MGIHTFLSWLTLPYPPLTPTHAQPVANGVDIIAWNGTQAAYFYGGLKVWSTAQPIVITGGGITSWSPQSNQWSLYVDGALDSPGLVRTVNWQGLGQNSFTLGFPETTKFPMFGTSYNYGGEPTWTARQPGIYFLPANDLHGNTIYVGHDVETAKPSFVYYVGLGTAEFWAHAHSYGNAALNVRTSNSSTQIPLGIIAITPIDQSRPTTYVNISDFFKPKGAGKSLLVDGTFSKLVPQIEVSSAPAPVLPGDNATLSQTWASPINVAATVGRNSFTESVGSTSNKLNNVLLSFDTPLGFVGIPVQEPTPANFTSTNWFLMTVYGVPVILDDAGHFYLMDLVEYVLEFWQCVNLCRDVAE